MVESFLTISGPSEGIYKEKGSKFLAFAYPVRNETEVQHALVGLRKKYYDARHHCYAYVLDPDKSRYRANDDGEPNHSGGDPILGQIRSRDLTDVLVIVVRYFGGVKLGVGGLVNAYRTATADALGKAIVVQCEVKESYSLKYQYKDTSDVMRLMNDVDAYIVNQEFDEDCHVMFEVKVGLVDQLKQRVKLFHDLGMNCQLDPL